MTHREPVELDCSILLNDRYYESTERRRRNIRKWVRSYWAEPLDMLLALTGQLTVWGEQLLEQLQLDRNNGRPVFLQQLARLYANACRVTDGICVLLAAGHADEAMGRWRTLFEHSVMARFLSQGDEDLARRYFQHHVKASVRAQKDYRRYHQRLGVTAPDKEEEEEARKLLEDYKQRYGASFASDYGWAGNLRFFDLAKDVGLDYLMPYYGMASYNVHADAKSLLTKLGVHESAIALPGPSLLGMATPGHCTAIALLHLFETVLENCCELPRRRRLMTVVGPYCDMVGSKFLAAHKQLEADRMAGSIHSFPDEGSDGA